MKKIILPTLLAISLCGNVFLFLQVIGWQKAWLAQILATANIEQIFRQSGADTSFQAISDITKKEFSSSYKIVSVKSSEQFFSDQDPEAIEISDSKLFFKNAQFIGSKAKLPDLEYWWFTSEL